MENLNRELSNLFKSQKNQETDSSKKTDAAHPKAKGDSRIKKIKKSIRFGKNIRGKHRSHLTKKAAKKILRQELKKEKKYIQSKQRLYPDWEKRIANVDENLKMLKHNKMLMRVMSDTIRDPNTELSPQDKARALAHAIRSSNTSELQKNILEKVDKIAPKAVPTISMSDKKAIAAKLKPGDLILYHGYGTDDKIDVAIIGLQKVRHAGSKDITHQNKTATHAALVVDVIREDGKEKILVAEATVDFVDGRDVRICELHGDKMELDPGTHVEYRIFECKDLEIAKGAADAAKHFLKGDELTAEREAARKLETSSEKREKQYSKHRYNIPLAITGMFHSAKFGSGAKKRALKTHRTYQLKQDTILSGDKPRKFFCSYFTSLMFQVGELTKLAKEDAELDDSTKSLSKDRVKDLGKRYEEKSKLKFDPKHMTPDYFESYVKRGNSPFVEKCRIIPDLTED